MDTFYEDIYWDSAKEWYITEEKDHVTGIPVIINESKEAIIFILNNPPQNGEIPETITIKDDSNIPLNKDIDGEYIVTEVYLKCKKWGNLRLPKNVKRINKGLFIPRMVKYYIIIILRRIILLEKNLKKYCQDPFIIQKH